MDTEKTAREHVFKRRTLLKKASRNAYAFFRLFVVFFGLFIAGLYAATPSVGLVLVPDFMIYVFGFDLFLLWLSEMVFRMSQYSSDVYCDDEECDITAAKKETPWFIRIALNFPFRGMHLSLVAIWSALSFYYAVLYVIAICTKTEGIICSDNFLLSFLVVGGAYALDYVAKGVFVFKIPELGKFMARVAGVAIESSDNWFIAFIKNIFRMGSQ
jgi:hypothetical protein